MEQRLVQDVYIGENMRALRMREGLTQDQVVARLQVLGFDISRGSYSKMESGIANVRVGVLLALKEIYHADFVEFFAGESNFKRR